MENKIFHNRYLKEKELGGGLHSRVFKAKDQLTGEFVALKVYMGQEDDALDGFAREYAIVSNVHHPNVLAPKHFDTCGSKPYLVLPFCERGSVMQFIRTPEFAVEESDAWRLLRDVASGLAHLHSMSPPIIHQDIKPDNILINDLDDYVITDFGISTRIKTSILQMKGTVTKDAGTTAYMAPERFEDDPFPIMANDVYSLGATVYEILTGDAPFSDIGGRGQDGDTPIPAIEESYSDELKDLITSCLSFDTSKRPKAANIAKMAQDWLDQQQTPKEIGRPTQISQTQPDGTPSVIHPQPTEKQLTNISVEWYYYVSVIVGGLCAGVLLGLFW